MIKKIFLCSLIAMLLSNIGCVAQKNKKEIKVLISTAYGDIKVALYNETPKHRDNFIKLVKEGTYDSTLFHRVMADFIIQGGDPDSKQAKQGALLGNGGLGYTVSSEFDSTIIHKKGVLAAARQPDNVNPNKESSSCQFYIVEGKTFTKEEIDKMLVDKNKRRTTPITYTEEQYKIYEELGGYPSLDMDYTVFGEVIEGLDVVDKISVAQTDRSNRPKEDIKMTMKIVKK